MALVAAMMVLALLATLTVAGISTSTLEVGIAANDRDAKQAFYLCEAGLEDAKYKIVRGWGTGSTTGGSFPDYVFTFDPATMPATVMSGGAIGWNDDQWVNFTLGDERGQQYGIQSNTAAYSVTTMPPTPNADPNPGFARIFYHNSAPLVTDQGNGTPGANQVVFDPAPPWDTDEWNGYWVRDDAGTVCKIQDVGGSVLGGGTYTLNLDSCTLGAGPYDILSAVNGVDGAGTITVYNNPESTGDPNVPNNDWRSNTRDFSGDWFLRDASDNLYAISSTQYLTGPARMVLDVGGTPDISDDTIQLVTNPFLVDTGSYDLTYSGAVAYGQVTVAVTPAVLPGRYQVSATTSSTGGPTKQLLLDSRLADGSQAQFGNWRLVQ
ncbi:MAG: pilus assembly PilX N-terminal domain-containing protein [Deferrisomatales bacterium]|nr:pilus assembly PilX N-terminal domain-containing protein [Deferrisomatales bacterium]